MLEKARISRRDRPLRRRGARGAEGRPRRFRGRRGRRLQGEHDHRGTRLEGRQGSARRLRRGGRVSPRRTSASGSGAARRWPASTSATRRRRSWVPRYRQAPRSPSRPRTAPASWRPPAARAILTGAFVNAGILAEELAGGPTYDAEVVVVGCGWEGRRASEDEAAAGAILHRLRSRGAELDGRARRVVEGYLSRPVRALRNNSAARRLETSRVRGGP